MSFRIIRCVRLFAVGALLSCGASAYADLALNSAPAPSEMRLMLDGPGLALENLKVTKGIKGQYGLFAGGGDPSGSSPVLGINDGLFLNTGNIGTILGSNSKKDYTYNTTIQYADPDLTGLSANAVYDPAILEFDIIPEGDQVNFVLVFGSDEYPEYVCSKFNDVFGLFVSGPGLSGVQNAAFLPGTKQAIAVNNVNAGKAGVKQDGAACQLGNSLYFVDNGNGAGATGTQMDGFTTPLTASLGGLQPKQRYHVKLALADAGDQAYDSAAFFKWLTSTSSTLVDLSLTGVTSTLKPDKNGYVNIAYTVKNHSATATRLVTAMIELPAGMTLMGEDSAGAFDPASGEWVVGNVAANASRTLNLRLQMGSDASYRIPAELTYAFNKDPDSTPYNRLARPSEDDTAILQLNTVTNTPPSLTNNGSAATHNITVPENTSQALIDYQATDPEGETEGNGLTWRLGGGADDALFSIDKAGLLKMKASPDFESPKDQGTDNRYDTTIQVCDSYQSCDQQLLVVTVTNMEEDRDRDGVSDEQEVKIGSNPDNPDTDNDGLNDLMEFGAGPQPKDSDGDGKIDVLDNDDDNDGILSGDENHNGGTPADDDTDKDGIADYLDADDDNDGIPTRSENYNGGTALDDDTDKDGMPDYRDGDDDADSLPTSGEAGKDSDKDGIPDHLDADDDNDGVPTATETGLIKSGDIDGDTIPNHLDTDDDGDGFLTKDENYNGGSPTDDDTDQDNIPDYLDKDDDGDGLLTKNENYNGGSPADDDSDQDSVPDYLDKDDDGDGKPTASEQADPNQDGSPADAADADGDGEPDYLDAHDQYAPNQDNDGDGLTNAQELAIGSNPDNVDSDADGILDKTEIGSVSKPLDTDADGIPDIIDTDDDGDTLLTRHETGSNTATPQDGDKDGKPDYLDRDDDNDSVPTRLEQPDPNQDGKPDDARNIDQDGKPDYLDRDDDEDGILTWFENYNSTTPMENDTDQDGTADYLDSDDDNDSLLTRHENPDPNGNGNPDDGRDSDKDNLHDYRDADDDNDGRLTKDEKPDPNGDGKPDDAADDDLDTLIDYLDPVITPFVRVQLRAFLQGPYNLSTGLMEDDLRKRGVLPKNQPYGTLSDSFGYTNSLNVASPFGHPGKETLSDSSAAITGPDAVVDWVLLEIRDGADPTKRVALRAGALQRDGDIVDATTGAQQMLIHEVNPGNYYLVVGHRNHMAVMSSAPVALSPNTASYDFAAAATPVYGSNARITNKTVALMRAGDVNNSNTLIVSGPGNDMNVLLGALLIAPGNAGVNSSYQLPGYFATDINLDGVSIYAGPNNDANTMLGNVLLHPENTTLNSNFIVYGTVPKHQ